MQEDLEQRTVSVSIQAAKAFEHTPRQQVIGDAR